MVRGVLKTDGSNVIVLAPEAAFASRIACRRLPAPLSFALVTTNDPGVGVGVGDGLGVGDAVGVGDGLGVGVGVGVGGAYPPPNLSRYSLERDESLHHFGIVVIAVELIQLRQPKVIS